MICNGRNSCILPGFEIDVLIAIDGMTYERICACGATWGGVADSQGKKGKLSSRAREIGVGDILLRPAGSMVRRGDRPPGGRCKAGIAAPDAPLAGLAPRKGPFV